jgi:hypothetical protein
LSSSAVLQRFPHRLGRSGTCLGNHMMLIAMTA